MAENVITGQGMPECDNTLAQSATAEKRIETMSDAVVFLKGMIATKHPEITKPITDRGWFGTLTSFQYNVRVALGEDYAINWQFLCEMEKTEATYSKSGTGKSKSCPLGKQHFSGHDMCDLARAYVKAITGSEELADRVPKSSVKNAAKRAQEAEIRAEIKARAERNNKIAHVASLMNKVIALGPKMSEEMQGKTKEVVAIMNGFDTEAYEKFVGNLEALADGNPLYAEEISDFIDSLPSGPEHTYTADELRAIPELATAMALLASMDAQYKEAFEAEEEAE